MRKLVLAMALVLFSTIAAMAQAGDRAASATIRDRFAGAWRLVWLEEPDANGNIHRADCTGLLVFTGDGHMSVQVMYRNPQPTSAAAPVQYAQGGYEASFGTYQIGDDHTFSYRVEGALVQSLIGKDFNRVYEITGNQMIVRSPDPKEHWRVAWERY